MFALLGPVGFACLVLAYLNLDVSGFRVFLFGLLGVAAFGFMVIATPATKGDRGDCFIDWDSRSNSTVCD